MRLVVLGLRLNIHATAPSNITLNGHGSARDCVVIMKDGKIFKNTVKQLPNNQTHDDISDCDAINAASFQLG